MALAQEQFADPREDDGIAAAALPDEPPASGRTRAGRVREPDESEGKLAHAVDELKAAEDAMRGTLADVQRVLHRIEARRVHEDAGYTTCAEFEERMLAWAPLVRVMRAGSGCPRTACPQVAEDRRDPAEDRSRSVKALTAIAHALTRVRSLEAEMRESAVKARGTLDRVESGRLFEECGYASYEEFLERAVGPSPLLACAIATLAVEASRETPEAREQVSQDEPVDEGRDELPAALGLDDLQLGTGEPDPTPLAAAPAPSEEVRARPPGSGSSVRIATLAIVAALVCGIAGLGGAYAGVSLIAPQADSMPEGGAPPVSERPTVARVVPAPAGSAQGPKNVVRVRNAADLEDSIKKNF